MVELLNEKYKRNKRQCSGENVEYEFWFFTLSTFIRFLRLQRWCLFQCD